MLRQRDPSEAVLTLGDVSVCYRRYVRKVTTLKDLAVHFFGGSQYESFWGLRDVSLSIAHGERLGVIGANGSGKSTLLKVLAGVLPPTVGQVTRRGRIAPILGLGAGFKHELTGRENIFLNGAIMGLGRKDIESRLESIVDFSGIGDFIDSPLRTYSSGMRARLSFAVATEVDADILLLDEVLSVGDAQFTKKASERMQSLFDTGQTIVMVSHNLSEIKRICSRAICLKGGVLHDVGDPDAVISRYLAAATPAAQKSGT